MEIEVDGAPNQQIASPDEASDNVMYFRTIMKSPVRKASTVVRSKEAGQKAVHLVVSSKESCLEVIKDSAHELIHLFDENVFGTIWDLKVHNYDFIAREDIELMVVRQAISVEHVTSARLPDAFQGLGMDSGQDLVLKVNEVFLPRAAKSKSLWVDMSDFEEHRAYGHRISVAPTGSAVVISALEDRMCILPLSKRLENKGQIFDAEMDAVVQQLVAKVIPVPGGKLGAIADLQFTHNDESGDNILHFAALVLRKGKGGFSSVLLFKANLESRTCFLMRSFNTQFCLTTVSLLRVVSQFVSSVSASDQILLGGEGGILLLDTSSASNYPNIGSEGMLATDMEISLSERRIPPLNELGGPNTLVTCIHVADCKEHHGNIKQREIILISTEEGKIWVAEIFQKASFEVKLLGSIDSPIVPSNIVSILGQGGYRRFLVNGDNGDSAVMMMRLNGNEIEIETLERLTMLGVTTDFTVLSDKNVNGGDEFDVLVCSGTGKHASIRRLRYGLPVETHVRSEKGLCDGIVGLYTITFEQKHDQSFLFMAFTTGCRVLTVGSELSDVTDDLGLNPTALTLHAAANSDGHLIQVSDEEVIVIQQPVLDSMDLDVIPCSQPERAVWRPAESTKISVSASLGNLVMCCTCGGTSIHILDTTRDQGSAGEFQIRGEITSFRSSEEVSCMAMTSLGAHGSETRKISIIGTYADALKARAGKIKIYSLGEEKREVELAQSIDLGIYSGSDLSGSVPQSFGILPEPAGGVFLVVGLRNGKVIIFTLNALSLPLVGLGTTRRLAESPITFVSITSYAGPSLIALVEDVAFLVTPSRASLQFQRIGFQPGGISHAAPFICDACPLGMAIVVDGQLKLVSIDRCEKLDVKTIPLALESEHTESESKLEDNFMPARVVWHPDAKLVIVGCNYSRKVCGAEEEPENKVMCCELRLIDHVSWSTVHVQHIGENERIHALALYRTLEDEVLVCVGTGPEISLVSKAQREVESTSLFEKRSASLNENESERSSDSDNEDQGVGDESPTGNETNLKRRRRESKVNSRLLIWRIVQKSGAPELVLVASISTRNACRAICQYQSCLAVATGETWTLYEFSRVRLEKKERSCNKTRFRRLLSKTARFLITSLTSNGFHLAVGDCVDSFSTWRIAFPVFSWQMRATRGYFARLEVRVCTESPQALKLEDCAIDLLVGNGFLPTIDNFTFKFTPTSGGCEFWKETSEGVHFAMVDYHAWGSDEGPPEGTKLKPVYIAIHAKASQSEVKGAFRECFQSERGGDRVEVCRSRFRSLAGESQQWCEGF
ncbi:hypothetical protein GUITHDRAFT_134365 [Guillardia theta CCMP2712]|uniref:Uncharacterized protein n=1 Tax=Guillardia theta (strain CCMP2712) TaxID=905079 RepID=L1JS98_GUITC|nr:hypothetical protein GUITHDRAFT_134365 [Guillardia theta CCMP2712]EKX51431.1 hypothetical protein GUITHDRAFT_134365 [Guillardia theta CCMP2712]|eukprot:XP_005838411.1 hypothetical protein GUITHDRAFT_134365 [Guillardia theta CCMP2712]